MTPTKTQTTNSEKKTKSVGREWGKENIIRVQCKLLIDMWPVEKSQWHKYDKYFWMANDRLTVFLMLYIIRITAHHCAVSVYILLLPVSYEVTVTFDHWTNQFISESKLQLVQIWRNSQKADLRYHVQEADDKCFVRPPWPLPLTF